MGPPVWLLSLKMSGLFNQGKYKEEGQKELSLCLYALLPETMASRHAREASALQSQVGLGGLGGAGGAGGGSALEVTAAFLLQVWYRDGAQRISLYHRLAETSETQRARQLSALHSQVGARTHARTHALCYSAYSSGTRRRGRRR